MVLKGLRTPALDLYLLIPAQLTVPVVFCSSVVDTIVCNSWLSINAFKVACKRKETYFSFLTFNFYAMIVLQFTLFDQYIKQ